MGPKNTVLLIVKLDGESELLQYVLRTTAKSVLRTVCARGTICIPKGTGRDAQFEVITWIYAFS